jgi:chromosome partitioning protein
MGSIYTVANQKGGVGKTTTVVNLAAYLAQMGKKTLVIDVDPQGNATSGLGIAKGQIGTDNNTQRFSTYDVLINHIPINEAIYPSGIDKLDILPSSLDLAGAELELAEIEEKESVLRQKLNVIHDSYDFILLDAPPSLGLLTVNALVAAEWAIIPIQCEYYALEGVSQLMRTFQLVQKRLNPELEIGLIIMTMYDSRVRLGQQVIEEVRKAFGQKVSRTLIPRNIRLSEAPSHGVPISIYDPKSSGARAYHDIAEEIINHGKKGSGEGSGSVNRRQSVRGWFKRSGA